MNLLTQVKIRGLKVSKDIKYILYFLYTSRSVSPTVSQWFINCTFTNLFKSSKIKTSLFQVQSHPSYYEEP